MSNHTPDSVADEASSESSAARLARYAAEPVTAEDIERLMRLAKLGEELAEEAAEESRAKNTPDPAQRAQRRRDFERLTRAMRMTLQLKAKLLFMHNAWQLRKAKAAADEGRQAADRAGRTQRRDETLAVARDVIQATQPEHEILQDPGGLGRWYDERDREKPLAGSSLGAVIAGLCKEIAVTPDWRRWQGSWVGDAQAAMPYEPPYEPIEVEWQVVDTSPFPGGEPVVVAVLRRGPDGKYVEHPVPLPPGEAAEPPVEEAPAPPAAASMPQGPPHNEAARRHGWAAWADP